MLFQSLVNDPYVNQNPAYAWELRANYIKALGKKNIEKIIGPKPDYQLSPGDIQDENLLMYQEQSAEVKLSDDHLAHMNAHAEFKRGMHDKLTPQAQALLTAHLLEHRFKYTEKLQQLAMTGGENAAQQGPSGSPSPTSTPRNSNFQGPRVGPEQGGAGMSQGPAPEQPGGGGEGGGAG